MTPAALRRAQSVKRGSARIYAPDGTLWLKPGTTATGRFVARHVRLGAGVSVAKDGD